MSKSSFGRTIVFPAPVKGEELPNMYKLERLYGSEVYLATSPLGTGAVLNLDAIYFAPNNQVMGSLPLTQPLPGQVFDRVALLPSFHQTFPVPDKL